MENNVEDVKVEETGVETQTTEKIEGEAVNTEEMISKTEAQKMVDKALAKKLPPKQELEEFKKWKDSKKTEDQVQAEKEAEFEKLRQENINLKNEITLIKKGISQEDVDYVLFKVGKQEGEFDENLEIFLKENPKFIQKQEPDVKDTGVKTIGNSVVKESGVSAILKARHPELYN